MSFRAAKVFPDWRFIFDGQSLNNVPSPGTGLSMPEVATHGLGFPMTNVSINGAGYTNLLAGTGSAAGQPASTRLHPIFRHSASVVLVLNAGTRDVDDGDDAATIMADADAYVDAAQAAAATYGTTLYVIGCTVPPSVGHSGPGEAAAREGFNSLLKAAAGGANFDAVVDLTENEAGPLYNNLGPNYVDGVHWSAAGADYAASLVRPTLLTPIGA